MNVVDCTTSNAFVRARAPARTCEIWPSWPPSSIKPLAMIYRGLGLVKTFWPRGHLGGKVARNKQGGQKVLASPRVVYMATRELIRKRGHNYRCVFTRAQCVRVRSLSWLRQGRWLGTSLLFCIVYDAHRCEDATVFAYEGEPMKAECPECGWSKKVPDHAEGKKGKCPKCGEVFTIIKPIPEEDRIISVREQGLQRRLERSATSCPKEAASGTGTEESPDSEAESPDDTEPLHTCYTCGGKVSKTADTCPHCGEVAPTREGWEPCPKCGSKDVQECGPLWYIGGGVISVLFAAGSGGCSLGCILFIPVAIAFALAAPIFFAMAPFASSLDMLFCNDCHKWWSYPATS